MIQVSLIATVLNEGESIRRLMDSLVNQTRLPDEIIICDGGSTDNTVTLMETYSDRLPLRVIVRSGANISEGRNAAIAEAIHEVIAVTDAGVRLAADWLEELMIPFEQNPDTMGVAGFFLPDTNTSFEVAMGATVLPAIEDIKADRFMPSSRSAAFKRSALESIGGYPEWLDFCEDLILDFRMAATYGPFSFTPEAVAYFRPRSSLRAFVKQYYLYARGDGKANLFLKRHLVRYVTYVVVLPVVLMASLLHSPWWLAVLLVGGAYMFGGPVRRLLKQWSDLSFGQKISAMLWVPVIRVVGDWAKMAGYPMGLKWRWRNNPPEWQVTAS